jgi:hypothetical protein
VAPRILWAVARAGRGLPGGARGATGGGLTPVIKGSARKRANLTRKRAEVPIMAAGRLMIGDPVHPVWFGPQWFGPQ